MVLAVIPALNEERHIEACIRSLMQGEPDLRRVLLVVADGGSSDGTVGVVKRLMEEFPNLRLINNTKRLQAAAMNLAVRTFAGPSTRYVVRCDAHSIYPDNFILSVARSLEHTHAASVVVPMDATGETCFEKANAWIVDTPLGSGGSAHRGGRKSRYVDHGHHAGFDLAIWRKIGGYDETFSHNEDAEYDERVALEGGRIFLDADIRIVYVPRGTVKTLAKQYYSYGKGRARNVRKHKKVMKLRQIAPVLALLGNVAGLLAAPVFPPALLVPLGYLGILGLASVAVALWKRSACGLLAGLASGTMHMSWAAGFLKETFLPPKTV
ncbi:MAG: glycosyltransferase family 2 protein [Hyphomonas sp.]